MQVSGRQSASPRHDAAGQRAPLANGKHGHAQLQLSQPPNTQEQTRNVQHHQGASRHPQPAWPVYRPPEHAPAASANLGRPGGGQRPQQAGQSGGVHFHQQRPGLQPRPQPQTHAHQQQPAVQHPTGAHSVPSFALGSGTTGTAALQSRGPPMPESLCESFGKTAYYISLLHHLRLA